MTGVGIWALLSTQPAVRRFTAASAADWLAFAALPVGLTLGQLAARASPAAIGLIVAAPTMGLLVGLPVAGTYVDRFHPVKVMQAATLCRAVTVLAVAVSWNTTLRLELTTIALVVFGLAEAPVRTATAVVVPQLAGAAAVVRVNGLLSLSSRSTALLGPALAAAAIGGGVGTLCLICAALLLLAAWFIAGIDLLVLPPAASSGRLLHAARFISRRPVVWWVLLAQAAQALLFLGPVSVLLPLGATQRVGTWWYAVLASCGATGGLLGALLVGQLPRNRTGVIAVIGLGVGAFSLLGIAVGTPPALTVPLSLAGGLGLEVFWVLWASALQTRTPAGLVAAVTSFDWFFSLALVPVGVWISVPALQRWGVFSVSLVACCAQVAIAGALLAVPGMSTFAVNRTAGDPGRVD